jgi:hypothetical protein
MSEQAPGGFEAGSDAHSHEQEPAAERSRTGVASVDAVLEELDTIDDLPLEEHVAAFERAHESLRSALDAAPDAGRDASRATPGELG